MTPPAYRAQMRYHITPIIAENDRWLAIKWHYKNNFCFYHILWLAVVIALRSGYANKQLMEQTKKKMEEQILESAIGIPQFRQQRSKCQITTNHIIYKYCESNTRNAKIKMLIIYRNTKKPTSWYLFVSAFPIFFCVCFVVDRIACAKQRRNSCNTSSVAQWNFRCGRWWWWAMGRPMRKWRPYTMYAVRVPYTK